MNSFIAERSIGWSRKAQSGFKEVAFVSFKEVLNQLIISRYLELIRNHSHIEIIDLIESTLNFITISRYTNQPINP